ncbi:MAG: class I SAM-dependent methyltransferase [Candidatus Magasanikbacteria bacterium]|nr:class I SAM-dependent methyltransferase [Candidatus Magasanikbacteria bacterium]
MLDTRQKFDIGLHEIVPEYQSANPLVRWLFHRRLTIARDFLRQTEARNFLDVGCGQGAFIELVLKSGWTGGEIWGIDLNPSVGELKQKLAPAHFAVQDLNALQFPSHSFDAIVTLDTLEHIADLLPPLAEFRRVLKPGGYLITSEPVESAWYKTLRFVLKGTYSMEHGPGAGVHYHNARGVERIIRASRFELLKLKKLPLPAPLDLFHLALYQVKE